MQNTINVTVIVKLEPDLSEGNVSYNADGTLNRSQTKSILGADSAIASRAAFYSKVLYDAKIKVCTMGPPISDIALKQAMEVCDADELHLYSDRVFAGADTLATAEAIKTGIERMGSVDLVISGHRAVDGETGQTGPQVAWKLGFNFLGNVVGYSIDVAKKMLHAKRLIEIQGLYNVLEEVECPMPALIAVDPSYDEHYTTVSQHLKYVRLQRDAMKRIEKYKQYLKVWKARDLGVDMKNTGLRGSPTIVYKVEKVPRAKASRQTKVIDIGKEIELNDLSIKLVEMLSTK